MVRMIFETCCGVQKAMRRDQSQKEKEGSRPFFAVPNFTQAIYPSAKWYYGQLMITTSGKLIAPGGVEVTIFTLLRTGLVVVAMRLAKLPRPMLSLLRLIFHAAQLWMTVLGFGFLRLYGHCFKSSLLRLPTIIVTMYTLQGYTGRTILQLVNYLPPLVSVPLGILALQMLASQAHRTVLETTQLWQCICRVVHRIWQCLQGISNCYLKRELRIPNLRPSLESMTTGIQLITTITVMSLSLYLMTQTLTLSSLEVNTT